MVGSIPRLDGDGECGGGVVVSELRRYERIAQGNIAAGCDMHVFPKPHVFVGWCRIPINPGNSQVAFVWSEDLNRQDIRFAGCQLFAHIKFKNAECARDIVGVPNFFAIHPNVGPII